MNFKKLIPFALIFLAACSSKPIFQPEVGGAGAKSYHGGVVYSIPPQNPVLKMNLVSLGINKDNMLLVRMYFVRHGQPANEYLNPKEQSILLPDSTTPIFPAKVHAYGAGKPLIKLAAKPKQGIELLFPLPPGGGGEKYPFIKLNWKIHYVRDGSDRVMAQTERFDYVYREPPQEGVGVYDGDDLFPPYAYSPFPEDWYTPEWIWW
jgi:hypothetical protein